MVGFEGLKKKAEHVFSSFLGKSLGKSIHTSSSSSSILAGTHPLKTFAGKSHTSEYKRHCYFSGRKKLEKKRKFPKWLL